MSASTTARWLSDAIRQATRSARFCVSGSLPVVDPGLVVDGLGAIRFPLKPALAKKLVAQCRVAPYGKGTETLVDTKVRNTFELDPKKFRPCASSRRHAAPLPVTPPFMQTASRTPRVTRWTSCSQSASRLVVLDGDYVGLELAQAMRRFGSRVTVVERKGSPCSLVLTKTTGSFDRATKRFEANRRLLKVLEEVSEGIVVPKGKEEATLRRRP